jgi:hypothetical protein
MSEQLYTREQLDIELLKNTNEGILNSINRLERHMDTIESNQKWMIGLMGTGFLGLLSLMAHGFNWII